MQLDCDAKSHVIVQLSLVFMAKHASEQQVANGCGTQGMVPQGPNEAENDDDGNEITFR